VDVKVLLQIFHHPQQHFTITVYEHRDRSLFGFHRLSNTWIHRQWHHQAIIQQRRPIDSKYNGLRYRIRQMMHFSSLVVIVYQAVCDANVLRVNFPVHHFVNVNVFLVRIDLVVIFKYVLFCIFTFVPLFSSIIVGSPFTKFEHAYI
jgi:hypothetical protein